MNHEIDIWQIDLRRSADLVNLDVKSLSDDELERLSRFKSPGPALIFAQSRSALRRLLADRLCLAPRAIELGLLASGKPIVLGYPSCHFNISHSGDCALIAVHDTLEVGVDIEHSSSFASPERLAPYACSLAELSLLRDRPGSDIEFLATVWTVKEAALKAAAIGLSVPPNQIDLARDLPAGTGHLALGNLVAPAESLDVRWQTLALAEGRHGAVAARTPCRDDRLIPRLRTFLS